MTTAKRTKKRKPAKLPPKSDRITDKELCEIYKATGHRLNETMRRTGLGKSRIYAAIRHGGILVTPKSEIPLGTVIEETENAVKQLARQISKARIGRTDGCKEFAVMFGITVEKLLLLQSRPTQITQNAETTAKLDLGQLLRNKLDRNQIEAFLDTVDMLNGEPQPIQVSDPSKPVVYDDHSPDCVAPTEKKEADQ